MTHSAIADRPATALRDATAAEDVIPANLQMNDVQAVFAAVNVQGKAMPIPGMSASVTLLQEYVAGIPVVGPVLAALLAPFDKLLDSSFRWGKGLSITSADAFEIYATDRNVLRLPQAGAGGPSKDFSIVVWGGDDAPAGIAVPPGTSAGRPGTRAPV